MSTKATIKTFPRWASQVNGVSCQTLDHPNGHQTKANAETCQATRVRALTKASDGNIQDPTAEIISFPRFYVQTSAGQPCQHYIPGDIHKVGHKDQAKAEKCMGVKATSKATSQPEGMPTNPVGADYSSALVRRHFDTRGGCRRAGPVGGHRDARSAQDR